MIEGCLIFYQICLTSFTNGSLPVFCIVGSHQLLIGIEKNSHLVIAFGHPEWIGWGLDPGSNVVSGSLVLILVPDQESDVASANNTNTLLLLKFKFWIFGKTVFKKVSMTVSIIQVLMFSKSLNNPCLFYRSFPYQSYYCVCLVST